jgi:hypothetical protein
MLLLQACNLWSSAASLNSDGGQLNFKPRSNCSSACSLNERGDAKEFPSIYPRLSPASSGPTTLPSPR